MLADRRNEKINDRVGRKRRTALKLWSGPHLALATHQRLVGVRLRGDRRVVRAQPARLAELHFPDSRGLPLREDGLEDLAQGRRLDRQQI